MPNFSDAFKEGLVAAEKADAAQNEIDGVFHDLEAQILKETGNKVRIERRSYRGARPPLEADPYSSLVQSIQSLTLSFQTSWLIIAYNPSVDAEKLMKLAYWQMDPAGYPCEIEWTKQKHICEDKNALVNALFEFLKDPVVARKLYTLTKLQPSKSKQGDGGKKENP